MPAAQCGTRGWEFVRPGQYAMICRTTRTNSQKSAGFSIRLCAPTQQARPTSPSSRAEEVVNHLDPVAHGLDPATAVHPLGRVPNQGRVRGIIFGRKERLAGRFSKPSTLFGLAPWGLLTRYWSVCVGRHPVALTWSTVRILPSLHRIQPQAWPYITTSRADFTYV